ncbi:MAG TPA: MarR family transcriptional regulator [Micromonosporaceae bacterium]
MSTTDDSLAQAELTYLLGMAFQLVLRAFTERLSAQGYGDLRPVHGFLFQSLWGAGATSSELAERLGVTKQAAGQLVDDLAERGYLRREPHPQGGRRRLVVLTDQAREHLTVAGAVLHGLEDELAGRLGATSLSDLRTRLAALVRELAGDDLPPWRPVW